MLKICSKCKNEKELNDFPVAKRYKDGHRPECKACNALYYREYYSKNPERYKEKARNYPQHRRHNLTDEQYEALFQKYDGRCHLCLNAIATHIDHDHKCCSGNRSCGRCVRGILCSSCNTALGLLKDNSETINRINGYLAALS